MGNADICSKTNHEMSFSAKILIILVFLTLLLGTGSALAFLVPLPVAHGLSARGAK
jgi:hypothetical protein